MKHFKFSFEELQKKIIFIIIKQKCQKCPPLKTASQTDRQTDTQTNRQTHRQVNYLLILSIWKRNKNKDWKENLFSNKHRVRSRGESVTHTTDLWASPSHRPVICPTVVKINKRIKETTIFKGAIFLYS